MKRGALLVTALVAQTSGAAADERTPYRVDLPPTSGCPHRDAFVERVEARTNRIRTAREDEPATSFRIELEVAPGSAKGRLTIDDGDAQRAREVDGATCDEVVEALALITALTLDPEASVTAAPPPQDPAPPPDAPTPEPTTPPSSPRRPPAPLVVPATPSAPSSVKRSSGTIGIRGGGQSAIAPTLAASGGGFFEITFGTAPVFRPTFRAIGLFARSASVGASVGRARFEWAAGELGLCPISPRPVPDLSLGACVGLQMGAHRGFGRSEVSRQPRRFWSAGVVSGRWIFHGLDPIELGAEGGIDLPLKRTRFFFEPDEEVHTTPVAGGFIAVTAGSRLW